MEEMAITVFNDETSVYVPLSFLIWLVICTVACVFMLIVQIGFVLHDISKEKKEKKKDE